MDLLASSAPTWTGSLPTWLILVMGIAVAWRLSRGGGGSAVSELSKANEVLERANKTKDAQVEGLQIEVAHLKTRTDIAQALKPLTDMIMANEERAQARFEKTVEALEIVLAKLTEEKAA